MERLASQGELELLMSLPLAVAPEEVLRCKSECRRSITRDERNGFDMLLDPTALYPPQKELRWLPRDPLSSKTPHRREGGNAVRPAGTESNQDIRSCNQ